MQAVVRSHKRARYPKYAAVMRELMEKHSLRQLMQQAAKGDEALFQWLGY